MTDPRIAELEAELAAEIARRRWLEGRVLLLSRDLAAVQQEHKMGSRCHACQRPFEVSKSPKERQR